MDWNRCLIHAMLAIASYVCFGLAALSGSLYLYLGRKISQGAEGPTIFMEIRHKMNCLYLVSGFLLLSAAIVTGAMRAQKFWGSYWVADPKQIGTILLWLYYSVTLTVLAVMGLKKRERVGSILSLLSLGGGLLLILNILLNYLPLGQHHFL